MHNYELIIARDSIYEIFPASLKNIFSYTLIGSY